MLEYSVNQRGPVKALRIILYILLVLTSLLIGYLLLFSSGKYFGNTGFENDSRQLAGNTRDQQANLYKYIQRRQSDIGTGSLILVNSSNEYQFPKESTNSSVYDNKNKSYKVAGRNITLNSAVIEHFNQMMLEFERTKNIHDIIILSGFRTKAKQEEILNNMIRELGEKAAVKRAARPGYSEHHTGYGMDIGIFTDKGQSRNFTGTDSYGWVNDNCGNYGFILRYEADKSDITGITDEPWHFRYVGIPHANIMKKKGYCLEEYLDYLKKYDFNSKHLKYKDYNNSEYEIYYVPASDDITGIPVPRSSKYTISGNNSDGFIVTVEK